MENRSEGRVERKKRTVVLNDLPEGTSLTQLIDLFSQFGKMTMVRVDERHKGEKSVTVGLITFLTNEMAEKAVSSQLKLKNQLITVTWAKSLPKRNFGPVYSKTRVHISGIGKLTDDELSNLLGKCSLIYPKKSDPENAYVFAQFETEKEKQTAIDSLNGKKIDEHNTLKLSPAYQSKPRRKRVANE